MIEKSITPSDQFKSNNLDLNTVNKNFLMGGGAEPESYQQSPMASKITNMISNMLNAPTNSELSKQQDEVKQPSRQTSNLESYHEPKEPISNELLEYSRNYV